MSDAPQGPDWWLASDDRWYPPPRPPMPGEPGPAPEPGPPAGDVPGPGDPGAFAPRGDPTGGPYPGPHDPTAYPPRHDTGSHPAHGSPGALAPRDDPSYPFHRRSGDHPPQGWPADRPTRGGPADHPIPDRPAGFTASGRAANFTSPGRVRRPGPSGDLPGYVTGAPRHAAGDLPPGASPPGGASRVPLLAAISVLVIVAVGLLVAVLPFDDGPGSSSPDATAPFGSPAGGEGTGAGGTSGEADLRVAETGFSTFIGGMDGTETRLTYGFIVENAGDGDATGIGISVSVHDAAGNPQASASHTITVLRAGERVGIGDLFADPFEVEVAGIDVRLSEPSDEGHGNVPAEGTLTAEAASTERDELSLVTTFTAVSTYAQQVDYPSAYAIYRDEPGRIIGGSTGTVDFIPANGSTVGVVSSFEPVPGVASTEVYLDPRWFE